MPAIELPKITPYYPNIQINTQPKINNSKITNNTENILENVVPILENAIDNIFQQKQQQQLHNQQPQEKSIDNSLEEITID